MSSTARGATRGERTRAALVEVARTRFATDGFDGALGADIAAGAGVSEPSIAFHFGSKRGLLIAVMEDYFGELGHEIDDVIDFGLDPAPRLAAFTRWWIEHLDANRELLAELAYQARPGRAGDDVTAAYRRANDRLVRSWAEMIDQLKAIGFLRTDIDSRLILQTFVGATRQFVEDDEARAHGDARVDQLLDLLLAGASGESGESPVRRGGEASLDDLDRKLDRVLARLDDPSSVSS